MLKVKRIPKGIRMIIQGLPIVTLVGASLLPLSRLANQFLMLIVLLWIQVFFICECYWIEK